MGYCDDIGAAKEANMRVAIQSATKFGHEPAEWEVKEFAGRCARVCYLPGSLENLLTAPTEKNTAVAEQTLGSGHHSVYDHVFVSLALEGVPKILAMVLNNEHAYTTSEQSGRYTTLAATGVEKELYDKWKLIFYELIRKRMTGLSGKKVEKLALENARYFISVFAPTTTMVYTCSVRQLNYLYHWMVQFCTTEVVTDFELRLQGVLGEFCAELYQSAEPLMIPGLADNKLRGLSLLAGERRRRLLAATQGSGFIDDDVVVEQMIADEGPDEWGARGYSTNYWGSFAQLAQAHRHRTLHYEIQVPEVDWAGFYVPPILPDDRLAEWLDDMEAVRDGYPQGMLVRINESGRLEDLVMKCQERLCGEAQLEICDQTLQTARKYYEAAMWGNGRWANPFVAATLQPYVYTTGCKRMQLSGVKCPQPCWWIREGYEIEERFA